MNLVAAILILGATGHADRRFETADSIAGIVAQCVVGGVKDVCSKGLSVSSLCGVSSRTGEVARTAIQSLSIRIDGQPCAGWRAWGEAACRVGAYAADYRTAGSVGYSYRLHVRGYDIRRETRISDGCVLLTTDAWWTERVHVIGRITRHVPCHVRLRIAVDERDGTTEIVGTATGTACTSDFRCGVVRSIAERQAAEQLRHGLPRALDRIEAGGKRFYANGGDIADALDAVRIGITIGNVFRRR